MVDSTRNTAHTATGMMGINRKTTPRTAAPFRPALLLCAMALASWTATRAPALVVFLQEDHITLKAHNDKLTEILEHFVHAGVDVRMDPSIEANVTGEIEDEDIQSALDSLLEPFSYVLVWDVVKGPLGDLPKLAEIRVFRPDKGSRDLPPLAPDDGNLDVTRGPLSTGPLFVKDEILLSVRAGVNVDDFRTLLREIGGEIISSIPHLGVYRIRVPRGTNIPALVEQLQQRDLVAHVEPNYVFRAPSPSPALTAEADAEPAARPTRVAEGAPPVAILDSGMMSVNGLDSFVIGQLDALHPDQAVQDNTGHGTQMALIASGLIRPAGAPPDGSAEGVPLLAIRSFDDNGYASSFSMMNAIDYAVQEGARVLSMSWGTRTDSRFMQRAVQDAEKKGLILVASAGNEPSGKPVYPASYSGVINVSAMNADGSIWEKSNYGSTVYAAAPGRATFPVGHEGPPGPYAGTSIGAPFVAREISKYLARHPGASRKEVLDDFRASLTDAGAKGKDPSYGYGAFDAAAVKRFRAK